MADNEDTKSIARKRLDALLIAREAAADSGAENGATLPHSTPVSTPTEGPQVGQQCDLISLPDDFRKWPAVPRYLVAGLERRGVSRRTAVACVRECYLEAGGKP